MAPAFCTGIFTENVPEAVAFVVAITLLLFFTVTVELASALPEMTASLLSTLLIVGFAGAVLSATLTVTVTAALLFFALSSAVTTNFTPAFCTAILAEKVPEAAVLVVAMTLLPFFTVIVEFASAFPEIAVSLSSNALTVGL